jgi:hypothetical protein
MFFPLDRRVTAGGPLSLCPGGSVTLTCSTAYRWNNGDPGTRTVITTGGEYWAQLWTSSGCYGVSETVTVALSSIPDNPGSIVGADTVCANRSDVVFSLSPVPHAATCTWSAPEGATITSGQGTSAISMATGASSGSLSVIVTDACGNSATVHHQLTVIPNPPGPVLFVQSGTVTAAPDNYRYRWYAHDGVTVLDSGLTFTPAKQGYYRAEAIGIRGCSTLSDSVYIERPVAAPVPAREAGPRQLGVLAGRSKISIPLPATSRTVSLRLVGLDGRIIFQQQITSIAAGKSVRLPAISATIAFLELESEAKQLLRKRIAVMR